MKASRFDLSVIVPTYREAGNIRELSRRVFDSVDASGINCEMIVVDDDSRDGIDSACSSLSRIYPQLHLFVRKNQRGLSTAVIRGIEESRGNVLLVMDADLSHPPEKIPELYKAIRQGAEFAIGSRYTEGGYTEEGWSVWRKLNSKIATGMALPLVRVKDPMAGFFAFNRQVYIRCDSLSPIGYKIGLELMVKGRVQEVVEIPIIFANRKEGKSKLSAKEQANYLRHLGRLYAWKIGDVLFGRTVPAREGA